MFGYVRYVCRVHSYVCWTLRCPRYVPALCVGVDCVYVDACLGAHILVLHTLPAHAFTWLVSVICGYKIA